ncbi:Putative F-box/FBD/LRR-repeat protein At4g03220 [Linum perenne]
MNDSPPPSTAAAAASPISDLPEPLIHHIMSFLPPQSAAKLCLLSNHFLSAWNSTPNLSFQNSIRKKTTRFLDYIQSTINRRRRGINLERFRLQLHPTSVEDPRIDSAIDYAINCDVRSLDLEFSGKEPYQLSSLREILSVASLTDLRLTGFSLNPTQSLDGDGSGSGGGGVLIVSHPLLENLKLCSSNGIQGVKISCRRLKTLEIKSCDGLKSLDLDSQTSNLESLTFVGKAYDDDVYTVDFASTCPSMKRLCISSVLMQGDSVAETVTKLPNLESIRLENFRLVGDSINVIHENLKDVQLGITSSQPVRVVLRGHEFKSINVSYSYGSNLNEIDLEGCESLRSLKLARAGITDEWFERNATIFENLKSLELNSCLLLKNVKISNENLESLRLILCAQLEKVEVDAVNLDDFHYVAASDKLPELVLGCSGKLQARVSMPDEMLNMFGFEWLRHVLIALGQSKKLTLEVNSVKSLMIPKSARERKIAPWYDLRNMKVEFSNRQVTSGEIVGLVDSLLWLAPQLHTLSLILDDAKTLKFEYEEGDIDQEQEEEDDKLLRSCCERWWPIKCWRHSLREVTMENFDFKEKEDLEQFFKLNSRTYLANYASG